MAATNEVIIGKKELFKAYSGKTEIKEIYVGKVQVYPKVILDLWTVPEQLVFEAEGGEKPLQIFCGLGEWIITTE